MAKKVFINGNIAVAKAALSAGCKYFFGYPITPQSEIGEYLSNELPKIGGIFVQAEGEPAAIYMVYGGALTGERVMTSTASCGFSLMQEGISYIAESEVPCVVVDVMRAGPGIGTGGQQAQTDYRQVTKGGGHGAYRNIVLAPYSAQECYDLTQLAFHLADKYNMMTVVLSDFIIGRMAEMVLLKNYPYGPPPKKDWALKGKDKKEGKVTTNMGGAFKYGGPHNYYKVVGKKYDRIMKSEIRYETYLDEDADLLVIAYGSSARMAKHAINLARQDGLKVGMFRPISVWPFPEQALAEKSWKIGKVLVVEDSPGELVEDVKYSLMGKVPIHFIGITERHNPIGSYGGGSGILYPETILKEIKRAL